MQKFRTFLLERENEKVLILDEVAFSNDVFDFIDFACKHLGIKDKPQISADMDSRKYRSFGGYGGGRIRVAARGRHLMDVCRTLAHELVHYKQDLDGKIKSAKDGETGSPIENEANAKAAVIMRDWGKKNPHLFEEAVIGNLEEDDTKIAKIYPRGQGSDVGPNVAGRSQTVQTAKAHGNEPYKDEKFFGSDEKKPYMDKMKAAIGHGVKMPPVVTIPHPADPTHHVVVDGNHRSEAHRQVGVGTMPAKVMSHDDVHLASHDYGSNKQTLHPLSSFRNKSGSYDMNKPRPELGGKALKHYFVGTNGEHKFDEK
jgi:hypothetical protein